MRVLVIGGTNFIGPHVVAELDRLGAEITVYHRGIHEPALPPSVRHVHSPRASVPFLHFPSELTEPAPDVVLHMFPVGQDDTRAAVARFAGVAKRVVAISSGDVYLAYGRLLGSDPGPPKPMPLKENAALRETLYPYRGSAAGPADWTYHYEKILVERAVLASSAPVGTVLRLPAVYGPGDPYRRLRPYLKRMDDGRRAILLETAQAAWRWTHGYVENLAQAIALTVLDERTAGRVYNIGESSVPTVAERVRLIGRVAGWDGAIVSLPADRLPQHLRAPYEPRQDLVLDVSRFRSELDFTEPVTVEEGLRRTIAWERANPPETGDPGPTEYAAEDAALASGSALQG
jgi:nucleoside-diphosphate-sugar epimerase